MTLDMEVPLMPSYVGGTHPLQLLRSMATAAPRVPPSPPSSDSRASSASPAQPVAPRTGFSIADILKPNFGSKGDNEKGEPEEDEDVESLKDQDVDEDDLKEDQSIFKAEPLKERLKLPDEVTLKGRQQLLHGHKQMINSADLKLPGLGLVAPKALHGLPGDVPSAYYQSYYLYQQKYADYMQLYGQPGVFPFQLPSPSHHTPVHPPMKNQLQLAHEQLLAKHQLQHQHVQNRSIQSFPGSVPQIHPHHPGLHQAGLHLPGKDPKPDHSPNHEVSLNHHHRGPMHQSQRLHQGLGEPSLSPIASSTPSPLPNHRSSLTDRHSRRPAEATFTFDPRSSSPTQSVQSKISVSSPSSSQSPPLASSGRLGTDASKGSSGESPDSTSKDSGSPRGDGKDDSMWPAWVYCTRYSDRPSSGPRSRKMRRKDKHPDEKRPRTAFTNDQLDFLRREFEENKYLTEDRRQRLAKELNLTESQIKIWFQNKRAKLKKSTGCKNPLALSLMAQGLYKHTAENEDSASSVGGQVDE